MSFVKYNSTILRRDAYKTRISYKQINKKAVLSQRNRAMPQLFFGLKFADNIH